MVNYPQQPMPQQQQPAWQQQYQNMARPQQPMQYQGQPQQYQGMPQQMPQQYQSQQQYRPQPMQQQMPQLSQQHVNNFLNWIRSNPIQNNLPQQGNFQPQQSQKPVYQPTQTPRVNPRAYVPTVRFEGGTSGGIVNFGGRPTVGDAAADAWVQSHRPANTQGAGWEANDPSKLQALYAQYYSGAA
jgi:hypothetical protein